jgi:tetratricopeptide (TPR) repeat protein
MGSWIGLLILLAGAYIVVVLVRGLIQIGSWFVEEFRTEPRNRKREKHYPQQPSPDTVTATSSASDRRQKSDGHIIRKNWAAVATIGIGRWWAPLARLARRLASGKRYDYWIGAALEETDPAKKVKYLSKALDLDPGYEPGWGLKAAALLELERYEEAIECFDKVLSMRPNAMAWHKKGLCCYHLKRYQDAVACFDKARSTCADRDRHLFDEASHHKRLAEDALAPSETPCARPMP